MTLVAVPRTRVMSVVASEVQPISVAARRVSVMLAAAPPIPAKSLATSRVPVTSVKQQVLPAMTAASIAATGAHFPLVVEPASSVMTVAVQDMPVMYEEDLAEPAPRVTLPARVIAPDAARSMVFPQRPAAGLALPMKPAVCVARMVSPESPKKCVDSSPDSLVSASSPVTAKVHMVESAFNFRINGDIKRSGHSKKKRGQTVFFPQILCQSRNEL